MDDREDAIRGAVLVALVIIGSVELTALPFMGIGD